MKEIFSNPEVTAAITTAVVAILSAITALFLGIKQRQSLKKAEAYKETALAELEAEKIRLQQIVVDGSYIICPHCGNSVKLKDVEIKVKGD